MAKINNLLKRKRQSYILSRLNLHNKVLNASLCEDMEISEDTLRRDLQELAKAGKLIKVHGGALSLAFSEVHFRSKNIYSQEQKAIIAGKAISFIQTDMYVLTSGGTTILEMARHLSHSLRATFITGSIPALNAYMTHPNIDVIAVGDRLNKESKSDDRGVCQERLSDHRGKAEFFRGVSSVCLKADRLFNHRIKPDG